MVDFKYRFIDDSESLLSTRMGLGYVCREGERFLILRVRAYSAARLESDFWEPSDLSRLVDGLGVFLVIEMTNVARTWDPKAKSNREQTSLSVFRSWGSNCNR
jgi:hypothetical protein